MAWTTSGLYVVHWMNTVNSTYANRYVINLGLTTNKVTMYDNTATPGFSGTTGASWAAYTTSGEVTSTTGTYTAGGQVVASPTTTDSPAGTLKWTTAAETWSSMTLTAYGAIWYSDAVTAGDTGTTADPAFVAVYFGAAYTATNGTFTITPSGSGIFTIDFTP